MPGPPVRIGGRREGVVHALPVLRRGRPVDREPGQWIAEPHRPAELDQPGLGRGRHVTRPDPEHPGRLPDQHRIQRRLRRGHQQQPPRRLRQRRQPLPEALLDRCRQRHGAGQPETARKLLGHILGGQFQQRPGVAARLGHDPVGHPLIQPARDGREQQHPGVTVRQPAGHQLGKPREVTLQPARARRHEHGDRPARQVARHERESPRRRLIQPLRGVGHADQRAIGGGLRQQAHEAESGEEAIGLGPVPHAERHAQRVALRSGKKPEPVKERRAQLVQRRERQVHLGFGAGRPTTWHPAARSRR